VFFTPCLVSGIVKMKLSQFAVWNFIVGGVYVLSIGPSAYGVSQVAAGQYSVSDVGPLIAGVAVAGAAVLLGVRYHRRRRKARSVSGILADGAQTPASAAAEEDR
jgi:membrane protein DedA with SNARE-associated domain